MSNLRLAAQRLAAEVVHHRSVEAAAVLHDAVLEHPQLLMSGGVRFDTGLRRAVRMMARDQAGEIQFTVPGRILMYNLISNDPHHIWWQTAHAWRDVYAVLRRRGLLVRLGKDEQYNHVTTFRLGTDHFAEDVSLTRTVPDRRRRGGVRREHFDILTYWRVEPDEAHTHHLFDEESRNRRSHHEESWALKYKRRG